MAVPSLGSEVIQWNRKWQLEVFFFFFFPDIFFIHEDIKKKRVVEIPIMALKSDLSV